MPAMPRPRPPHLHLERSRHGKTVWYVRPGKGPRKRLRAAYGSPEFSEEYHAALSGKPIQRAPKVAGSIAWASNVYQQSSAWQGLAKATRRQRANILKRVVKEGGDIPLKAVTAEHIRRNRERRAATPAAARNYLETMRGLFAWALEADLVKVNPTEGVKAPRPKTDGFPIWSDDDIAKFEARWPVGTRPRVAFDLLRYTGLRRGDACRLGRPHVRDGVARIATEKSQGETWVALRLPQELLATIAAGPCGELTFIAREDRKPFTSKESFGNSFKEWCVAAGIPNKSAHGLRKVKATVEAEKGLSNLQLDATMGWVLGSSTSKIYVEKANRERLSLHGGEVTELRKSK